MMPARIRAIKLYYGFEPAGAVSLANHFNASVPVH